MKRSEQKDNTAMNGWMKRRIFPVMKDDCQVALRHLKLYTKRKSIGNPAGFARMTLFWCQSARLNIAQSLIDNSSASLEIRADAMIQLVAHALVYPRSTTKLDIEALRHLLQEEATTDMERFGIVNVARTVALSEKLWQATRENIESAVRKIGQDIEIMDTFSFETASMTVEASDKCIRVLLVLICKRPW